MYTIGGGCTSLFHLFVQYPILVAVIGVAGFVSQIPSNPGPGDRQGTSQSLTKLEHTLVREHPELATQVVRLRTEFDRHSVDMDEDEVRRIINAGSSCTDIRVQDIVIDPDERKEAAWIIYLDTVSREGPQKASKFFKPPQKE